MKRPATIKGSHESGDWEHQLWDFRETSEFLEDPEEDIDLSLRSKLEGFGHQQYSYQAYLESDYWKSVRATAVARAKGKCQACGREGNLQVHHKSYNARGAELTNLHLLEVLCDRCHEQSHS